MTTPMHETAPAAEDSDATPPRRGRVLAKRYRVGQRIGAGGMATILRGTDEQMDRPVAIKVLHAHLADDPEVRRRFASEARHAASLSHPHVVAVYDQGESDLPYIVLELVDGLSLREVLATHGPLSPAQVLAVIEPLCGALDAAHRIGLIHRDVKPENVLVTTEGLPKLADFGIARVMAATSHTATGSLVGSVHYLAPELVDGIEATPASDQYALAVVAFELLTGRKPLPADTPMAIALRHANEDIPPPSRYAPEVSAATDAVIARATAHDPAARYTSLEAMADALHRSVDQPPAPVTHLTDDGVLQTLVLPSEMAATTNLVTRPAAASVAADLETRRNGTSGKATPRRWPRRLGIALVALLTAVVVGLGGWLAWSVLVIPTVVLPDLVGQTQGAAFTTLEGDELGMDIAGEEHRIEVPAGEVISQSPAPGTEVEEGTVVDVVLSLGPRVVEMPDLLTQGLDAVQDVLDDNVFASEVAEANHDTVPEGAIIAQLPDPGTPIEQGSTISLTVSLGIEQVAMPVLAGQTLEDAESALADVRLTAEVTEEWSDEVPDAGLVISQAIQPDAQVDALSSVAVVVSRGPFTITVPDLRGQSVADAQAIVAGLGEISLDEQAGPVPTLGPFTFGTANRVERQIPDAGTPITRGEQIQIFYFVQG